ncbi:MAG: glycosyltransferase [Candidatus Eiseniibacteriota bacterium]
MRVLLLSSVEHQSGSALRFRGLAGALARRGHDVHLVEPFVPGSIPETPPGVTRHRCPRLAVRPEIQSPLWLLHGLAAVRRVCPDVVWALKPLPNVWIPANAARSRGARVAVDFDDLDHAYYAKGPVRSLLERFFRRAALAADDATCHNERMSAELSQLRGESRRPVFVDQGVDVARFADGTVEPAGLRARLGLGEGPVLLYAGHLGPASDLAPLLEAIPALARRRPEARLLVVGDGRHRDRLEALASRALPPGFAVFAGAVPHREVPAYYALADVALNYLEPKDVNLYRASIKTREALAAGVPVVASRTPDAERFAAFVRLADGPDAAGFVAAVDAELAQPDRERARAGAAWLAEHGTFDVAVREIAERWEAGAS